MTVFLIFLKIWKNIVKSGKRISFLQVQVPKLYVNHSQCYSRRNLSDPICAHAEVQGAEAYRLTQKRWLLNWPMNFIWIVHILSIQMGAFCQQLHVTYLVSATPCYQRGIRCWNETLVGTDNWLVWMWWVTNIVWNPECWYEYHRIKIISLWTPFPL